MPALSHLDQPKSSIFSLLRRPLPRPVIPIFTALLALYPLLFLVLGFHPGTGLTSLIYFGTDFSPLQLPEIQKIPKVLYPGPGYDGQFYVQLAIDPSLQNPQFSQALDNPAYRARRILLPWLSFIGGLGQPSAILQSYALINLLFFECLVYLLYRHLRPKDPLSLLCFAAALVNTGAAVSISRALPDLPAAVLLLYATLSPNARLAPLFLTLAAFSKETTLVALPFLYFPTSRQAIGRALQKMFWVVAPFAAWMLYIAWRLPQGSFSGSQNFSLPLVSVFQHLAASLNSLFLSGSINGLIECVATGSLLAQGLYLLRHPQPHNDLWRMGVAFLLLFCCLGPNVMIEQLAYARAVLPMSLAFNLLLHTEKPERFLPWYIAGNLGILCGLLDIVL